MLVEALSTARDLGRLHDIAAVLVRHGLGDAIERLGIAGLLERAGKALNWEVSPNLHKRPEVRVREALEQLGPTFVKVGQILAGRGDMLPSSWTEELSRLHEHATPLPWDEVRAQLTEDLGGPPEEIFRELDIEPLAAASIAQVHRASLADGTPVVLKVRRPGIEEVVDADLRLLTRLAERMETSMPELRRFRPRRLVRHFSRLLRNELDLRIEAKNTERIRANLPEDSGIVVPRIIHEWTHERLCVMEFLPGPSVGEWLHGDQPAPVDPAQIAELGADTILRMVFVDGCYHADPHPGNLLLLGEGRVGLIDFGMVGTLSEARRGEFLTLLHAVVSRDLLGVVGILLDWSDGEVDADLLEQDCAAFIDRYGDLPFEELDTSELLSDLTTLLRENDLVLPNDVALLLKVFVTLEGVGRQLDPSFVMAAHVEPFASEAAREWRSPVSVMRRGAKDLGFLLNSLPRDLRRLLVRARQGRLRVDIDVASLDQFGQRVSRSASRLTVGLVTSALIVGTSISLTVPGGTRILGLPLFGFLGFSTSLVAGIWLLWSIWTSSRK